MGRKLGERLHPGVWGAGLSGKIYVELNGIYGYYFSLVLRFSRLLALTTFPWVWGETGNLVATLYGVSEHHQTKKDMCTHTGRNAYMCACTLAFNVKRHRDKAPCVGLILCTYGINCGNYLFSSSETLVGTHTHAQYTWRSWWYV